MKKLNCRSLTLTIQFESKSFKYKKFFKDSNVKPEDVDAAAENVKHGFIINPTNKNEHAHISVTFNLSEGEIEADFHPDSIEKETGNLLGATNEALERNCFKLVSPYFNKKQFDADVSISFEFDKSYKPVLKLNYPLLFENDFFKGAMVEGYDISFPSDSFLRRSLITGNSEKTVILFSSSTTINLNSFDFYKLIEEYRNYAQALVLKVN